VSSFEAAGLDGCFFVYLEFPEISGESEAICSSLSNVRPSFLQVLVVDLCQCDYAYGSINPSSLYLLNDLLDFSPAILFSKEPYWWLRV